MILLMDGLIEAQINTVLVPDTHDAVEKLPKSV